MPQKSCDVANLYISSQKLATCWIAEKLVKITGIGMSH